MKHERFFAVGMTIGVNLVTEWKTDVLKDELAGVISGAVREAIGFDIDVIGISVEEKK